MRVFLFTACLGDHCNPSKFLHKLNATIETLGKNGRLAMADGLRRRKLFSFETQLHYYNSRYLLYVAVDLIL